MENHEDVIIKKLSFYKTMCARIAARKNNNNNNNNDDDNNKDCPLHNSSKRRKYNKHNKIFPSTSSQNEENAVLKRKSPILHMPTEIIQRIFSYLDYEDLATNVRLVNHRFRLLAQDCLNKEFLRLESRLIFLQEMVNASIQHSNEDLEKRCLCKVLNVIEILILHYSLLKATIWKFITKKYANWCMHGGLILDAFNMIMSDIVNDPGVIYLAAIKKDYEMPKDVKLLKKMLRKYIIHFETISENNMDQIFTSGSKLLDILDCATYAERDVKNFCLRRNNIDLEMSYYISKGWFIAYDIEDEMPKSWKEKQALIYMRLRRIVRNHTAMNLEYTQYKRECLIRPNSQRLIRKPVSLTYSGYGHSTEKFYYYGLLNEGAYFIRFRLEQEDELAIENDENNENLVHVNPAPLFSGLYINVTLKCPLKMAPYKILKELDKKHDYSYTTWQGERKPKGKFYLQMEFKCQSASDLRLPTTHFLVYCQKK